MRKGQKHTTAAKTLMSLSAKTRIGEKAPNYGRPKDIEWRRKISDTLKGSKLSEETKIKIGISSSKVQGGRNPLVGTAYYHRAHKWVYMTLGKPSICVECGTKNAIKYEWANLSQKYQMDISDWKRMCTSCHRKYDIRYKNGK